MDKFYINSCSPRGRTWVRDVNASNLWKKKNICRRNPLGGGDRRARRQFIKNVISGEAQTHLVLMGALECKLYLRVSFPSRQRIELLYFHNTQALTTPRRHVLSPCFLQAIQIVRTFQMPQTIIWKLMHVFAISRKAQNVEGLNSQNWL